MSLIIPTEYLQQKATPSPRGSRRVPTGFLQRGRAPSAPLRARFAAVAAPTARLRLIPCPRVIAALLAPPPTSGAVVAPPGLPPRGSLRRLAPRAPRAKAGSPPVRFALRSRCAQPTQPAGSYRVPKGFPSGSCGSRSFAGAPWLGLSPALYFRPLRSATLSELEKRPPPLHFGGLCPPSAVSLIPSALCTYRVGWGCASLVIRSCPHYRSIPSSFGLVCSGLPPVLFVWRRRVRLFEP